MHRSMLIAVAILLPTPSAFAGDAKSIAVWDTGKPAASNKDWTEVAAGKTAHAFRGDAVMSNGRIVAALRRQESALEIHAMQGNNAVHRIRLRLQASTGEPAVRIERIALLENGKTSAALEAAFETAKGEKVVARFRIKRGDVSVQVDPGVGAAKLRVESPGRFVILPDFFADDITIDAARLPLNTIDLPSENFVLHPTANGDAIAMCVFENRQQDVRVTLAGQGGKRIVTGSEIGFEKKKIWVALLDAPKIWHQHDLTPADTGKIVKLDWKMPYLAQWRVDFSRPNDLTDSWEMLLQEPGYASYTRHTWLGGDSSTIAADRDHWNTVLGSYPYPAWSDVEGRGYVEPIKNKFLQFVGPALIYPIHRVKETPLDAFTVVDVMRNTLGVGPCEHILDVQSHKEQYHGQATCGVRDILNPIYINKEQKARRDEINKTLDDGLIFVKHIRGRINDYIAFGRKTREYLAAQKKARPELAEFIDEMDRMTQEIDKKVAVRIDKIKTPDHVAKMNEEVRKNVLDYEGPDALKRCQAYTHALWLIGDNQDELSGELRWVVRVLRQRAGIKMGARCTHGRRSQWSFAFALQEVLRNPAWHEAARH